MKNRDLFGNPKWLIAVYLISLFTFIITAIIIVVMLLCLARIPRAGLSYTFFGSLLLIAITRSVLSAGEGRGNPLTGYHSDCDYAGDGSDDGGDGGSCN